MSTHRTWLFEQPTIINHRSPLPSCPPSQTFNPSPSPVPSPPPAPIRPTQSTLNHARVQRSTSTGLTFPTTTEAPVSSPLVAFATYAAFAMAALTGLVAILLTSYGLSAFDDARRRLTGVRGLVGKGLDAGRELVDGAREVVEGVVSAHQAPRSTQVDPSSSSRGRTPDSSKHDQIPRPVYPSWQARAQPASSGYTVSTPTDGEDDDDDGPEAHDEGSGSGSERDRDRYRAPHLPTAVPGSLPPRPPLTVLFGSVLLTFLIVAGRLMVMWWMGQQVPKNTSRAFRNGRRAYEAASRRGYPSRPTW
ncbi:hypothetical protein CROQUDRAFT_671135 [Cronartium quercuum f. sp. fusiforme G11]|uniref:Transmembrane protein n=1 Tax=Cronartium quercuum f. sp. fusiforme G11 TaxID=708437 RepID=A0A9P6NJ19_9BASI|nr:hypothetical protein CROQUDRAFT_671135 [Cronartium quercuum f. sp. fusiforme G11]